MSDRQHWEQHECCIRIHDAGQFNRDALGSVYSSKNEGESALVLLGISQGPFCLDVKMSPGRAEHIAKLLVDAAQAARRADETFPFPAVGAES